MEPINDKSQLPKSAVGGGAGDAEQPIRFAGSTFGAQRHVCAFFHSADEEYRVLLPFIKEGFERGEKAFHIVDPKLREEHLRRLDPVGIQNETRKSSTRSYLKDG